MSSKNSRLLIPAVFISLVMSSCSFFAGNSESVASSETISESVSSVPDSVGGSSSVADSSSNSLPSSSSRPSSSSSFSLSSSSSEIRSSLAPNSSSAPSSSSSSASSSEASKSSSSVPVHEHTFETGWDGDENNHWHNATCGHDVRSDEGPHNYVAGTVVEPTYESDGYTIYTCSVCGHSKRGNVTPKLSHSYSEAWSYDENEHWHACTDAGFEGKEHGKDIGQHDFEDEVIEADYEHGGCTKHKCKVCGYETESNVTDPLTHNYSTEWSFDSTKHWHACVDADWSNLKKDEDFHNFGSWIVTREPTSEANGEKSRTCQVCGYTETAPITNDQTSEDFTFILNDDKKSYSALFSENLIQAFNNIEIEELTYPDSWNGFPVTHVLPGWIPGSNGFPQSFSPYMGSAFDSLKTITIPNTVDTIEVSFLSGLTNIVLESGNPNFTIIDDILYTADEKEIVFCPRNKTGDLVIRDGVETIDWFAFAYCGFSSVLMPNTLKTINPYSFYRCDDLERVSIPSSVESFMSAAFLFCFSLNQVDFDLPLSDYNYYGRIDAGTLFSPYIYGVNYQGPGAYTPDIYRQEGSDSLSAEERLQLILGQRRNITLNLGPNATGTGDDARGFIYYNFLDLRAYNLGFLQLDEIFDINVDPSNPSYTANDGSLYSKDGSTLIYVPRGLTGEYTVSEHVTTIDKEAFKGCLLSNIVVSEGVSSIGNHAFERCSFLTTLSIPSTVSSIGENPFSDAISLASIDVQAGNPSYESLNGVLFTEGFKNLLFCPPKKTGSFVVPEETEAIDYGAFYNTSLEEITTPYIGCSATENQFFGAIFGLYQHFQDDYPMPSVNTSSLDSLPIKRVVITSVYTHIPDFAFYKCSSIESISFAGVISSVGKYAFSGCTSLQNINVSWNLVSIGDSAFANCSNLQSSITISSDVTSIGYAPFTNCSSLQRNEYDNALYLGNEDNPYLYLVKAKSSSITSCTINENCCFIAPGAFSGCSEIQTINIPDGCLTAIPPNTFWSCRKLKSVIIPDAVTSIGYQAFANCESLESIVIPDSVTSIGGFAFGNCRGLENLVIGDGVTSLPEDLLSGCSGLKTLTIGDGVTSLPEDLLSDCWNLKTLTIGDGVTSIPEGFLSDCDDLENLVIGDGVTSLPEGLISSGWRLKTLTIGDGVTSLPAGLLSGCHGLKTLTIGNGITSIPYGFLSDCSGLENLVISDGVTSIPNHAFYQCRRLESIDIPAGVTSIGRFAFDGNLVSITLPDNWVFDHTCFGNTPNLMSFNVRETNELYTSIDGVLYDKDLTTLIKCPFGKESVVIPSSVTTIADNAFRSCGKLKSVIIPDTVTSIGDLAFGWCENLESVTIGSGVTSIGDQAFDSCRNLESVTIGNGVTSIGDLAFAHCQSLASVIIPDTVTSIGEHAFAWSENLESVTIGSGVASIGDSAFEGCSSLSSVVIQDRVALTGRYEFYGCNNLAFVFYTGTYDGWVGPSYFEGKPIYFYSETEPTQEGNYWHYDANGLPVIWGATA